MSTPRIPTETELRFRAAWRQLAHEIYETGKAAGFYDKPHTDPAFNHGEKMMLVVSEISEGVEGLRGAPFPGIADDKLPHRPMIEVELADAVIRIMNYGSHCGLDVAGAVVEKNEFNKSRPHKHGGKRF